jgi:hypothetical protein
VPKYRVTDPQSGRSIVMTGDSAPTEQEVAQAFSAAHPDLRDAPAQPAESGPGATARMVSDLARPALETAGAIGGGLLAGAGTVGLGPVAIPATVAGGGLGLAAGKAAADLLDRGLGIKKPIASYTDAAKETGGDIKAGAEAEAMGLGAGAAIKGVGNAVSAVGKRSMSAALGPEVKDLEALAARNTQVRAAKPLETLARDLPDSVQSLANSVTKLRGEALDAVPQIKNAQPLDLLARRLPEDVSALSKKVSELSTAALDTLPESPRQDGFPRTALTDVIQSAKAEIAGGVRRVAPAAVVEPKMVPSGLMDAAGNPIMKAVKAAAPDAPAANGVSDAAERAVATLNRYLKRAEQFGETISQRDLGELIRDIDHDIDWDAKDLTPQNNALESIRSQIDGALKGVNPQYQKAMEPVAEGTRLLKKAETLFQVKKAAGTGYAPSNATAAALKGAVNDTRVDSQDVLDALKKVTGRDYLGDVENSLAKQAYLDGNLPPEVDAALRQANQKYAQAAGQADQHQQLLDKAVQIFQLKPGAKGLQAGDTTVAAIERAVGPDRHYSKDVLDALKAFTGRDFHQEAQDALTASKFVGGKANGSRRVTAGAALGAYLGNMLGGSPGAAAGAAAGGLGGLHVDSYGHEMAGSLVDRLVQLARRLPPGTPAGRTAVQQLLAAGAAAQRERRRKSP